MIEILSLTCQSDNTPQDHKEGGRRVDQNYPTENLLRQNRSFADENCCHLARILTYQGEGKRKETISKHADLRRKGWLEKTVVELRLHHVLAILTDWKNEMLPPRSLVLIVTIIDPTLKRGFYVMGRGRLLSSSIMLEACQHKAAYAYSPRQLQKLPQILGLHR